MKNFRSLLFIFELGWAVLPGAAAAAVSQSIVLRPGWNSIHVEVLPANPDLSAIFTAPEIQSVWAYENKLLAPDFTQDVTEEALPKMGWVSWVPTNRVDAFQNELFEAQVNRAYLVKNAGSNSISLNLVGRPSLRKPLWQPNAFNFLGFPIDPGFSPTFLNFFKPSPAHYSSAGGLQAMYRLNAAGAWQLAAGSDLMKSGEAYWVFCKGNSDYLAPLTAGPEFGDALDFGEIANRLNLSLQNLGSAPLNATISDRNAPAYVPISYAQFSGPGDLTWPRLALPMARTLAGGSTRLEELAIRRGEFNGETFETVLQIMDGAGTRLLLPVTGRRAGNAGTLASLSLGKGLARAASAPAANVGLWVGTAVMKGVSEAHGGELTTNISRGFTVTFETNAATRAVTTNKVPNSLTRTNVSLATTATGSEFRLRLLLHVDGAGRTRLLKEVIQMWKDGIATNDASGAAHVVEAGRAVLVTDESKLGQFTGINAKEGILAGRRLSTAAFDFPENELLMAGSFSIGSGVSVTNTISAESPLNPFKHRYHPDHQAGYDVKRVIELQVGTAPANASPGYGDSVLEGIYRETVSGLHRAPIAASGTFRLTRMATTAVLNQ